MGCGASKNDTAEDNNQNQNNNNNNGGGARVQRNNRKDVGQKRKEKKYKLDGPFLDDKDCEKDGWTVEPLLEGGLLFKLTKGDEEAFYNDTGDYEMVIAFEFGPDSAIEALDGTEVSPGTEGEGWMAYKQTVFPNTTKRFKKGEPNGHKGNYTPNPLSEEYKAKLIADADAKVQEELAAVKALGVDGKTSAEVLEMCVAKGIKFVDPNFPPCQESLQRGEDAEPVPNAPWRRPTDYLNADAQKQICLINGAEPDDIDQGALGDCWFLCSIASLAEFPAKVKDVFKHPKSDADAKKESAAGGHRITLCKGGWWREVVVDDYVPTSGAGLPRFAKNVQDPSELWVAMLEKAYSKFHGSYSTIVGGDPLHALQDLSGYPITRFDTEWKEALESRAGSNKLFTSMVKYDEAGYMLTLSTPGQDTSDYNPNAGSNDAGAAEKYKKAGLAMGHAYSVLQVKSFPDKDINLVRIRNPWGNATEWTGTWNDDDELWTKHSDVAKACAFEKAADGTFWMEWDDVKEYFDGGGCCFTKFDWADYRIKGQFNAGKPNFILEINVTTDVEMFLIISQDDKRGRQGASYKATLISVCEEDAENPSNYKAVRHGCSDADTVSTEFTFLSSRDVAMKHKFAAASKPYLLMLREYDAAEAVDFAVGVIASRKAGDGYTVTMKEVPAECKYYENYPSFEYNAAADVECEYQFNPEVGTFVTKKGTSLQ